MESETIQAGRAIGTNPPEGTTLKSNDTVELQVSSGPPAVAIPAVKGLTESAARAALEKAGFTVQETVETPSADVRKGRVVGTDPSGQAPKGSALSLQISSGPAPVAVPQVEGQSEADATAAVKAANLGVRIRTTQLDPNDPNVGRVVRQDPAAQTEVDPQSTVTLTIGVASHRATTTVAPTTTVDSATTTTAGP
jgi:serine/threonine-protein kinase